MKNHQLWITLLWLLLGANHFLYGQERATGGSISTQVEEDIRTKRFRYDYTHVTFYEVAKEEWSDWKKGNFTFVFNINDHNDIMFISNDSKKYYYRNLSGLEQETDESGNAYQIIKILDEEGVECHLNLYDKKEIGLQLIYSNLIIQFSTI